MNFESEDDDATTADEHRDDEYDHLENLSDGAGCTEIWEHLSDSREESAAGD